MFDAIENDLDVLFDKFRKGTDWINKYIKTKGRTAFIEHKMNDFEAQVMEPLDRAWELLTEDQRAAWEKRRSWKK